MVYTANWVIIYYRSHPLQEPEKSIEDREEQNHHSPNPVKQLKKIALLKTARKNLTKPGENRCEFGSPIQSLQKGDV